MTHPEDDLDLLLEKWEESYKKGLLSFWMLLLLNERPTYAFEMNALIVQLSRGTISADDNSLYRALGRFEQVGLVSAQAQPSPQGPARRYYTLTPKGRALLAHFIQRNLLLFQQPELAQRLQGLAAQTPEIPKAAEVAALKGAYAKAAEEKP
jgi:PadR family transcriptional regulator PadR